MHDAMSIDRYNNEEKEISHMAKSRTQKKIENYKQMSRTKLIVTLVALLLAAMFYIYTSSGEEPHRYSAEQNPDTGNYYYHDADLGSYYYQANDLIGAQLQSQLNDIISNGFVGINYGDDRYLLEAADQDQTDTTKLWNIYNSDLVDASWDAGHTWAREHVWPNSKLGIERVDNSEVSQASDAHNLRSITPAINSSRSNRFFSDGSGEATTTDDGGFYPGDDHRGDVARILFYMETMYDFLTLTDDINILTDESNNYEPEGAYMGRLSLLLTWHKEDPVSAFEIERNNIIYQSQANRNPFIDHPEYVHLIWEGLRIDDIRKVEESTETAFAKPWKESTILWMSINLNQATM